LRTEKFVPHIATTSSSARSVRPKRAEVAGGASRPENDRGYVRTTSSRVTVL